MEFSLCEGGGQVQRNGCRYRESFLRARQFWHRLWLAWFLLRRARSDLRLATSLTSGRERVDGERRAKLARWSEAARREQRRAEESEKTAAARLKEVDQERRIAAAVRAFLQRKLLGQADVRRRRTPC